MPYYTLSPTYSICKNHGYLTGEQHSCEDCGEVTEVYSRITGYYRPVQNWNAGKTQEYKARRVYDVSSGASWSSDLVSMKADGTPTESEPPEASETEKSNCSFTLVTTEQCPNCVTVQTFMNAANIEYDIVDVSMYPEVVKRYSVRSAPTLIVRNGNDYNTYANESNIRAFVTSQV